MCALHIDANMTRKQLFVAATRLAAIGVVRRIARLTILIKTATREIRGTHYLCQYSCNLKSIV